MLTQRHDQVGACVVRDRDGGTVALPGALRHAVACVRVDCHPPEAHAGFAAIQSERELPAILTYGSYSPAGLPTYTGNAITDNYAELVKPAG